MPSCPVLSQSWLRVKRNCGEQFRLGIITCTRVTLLPGSLAPLELIICLLTYVALLDNFHSTILETFTILQSLHRVQCPQLGARVGLWPGQESHESQQVSSGLVTMRTVSEPSQNVHSARVFYFCLLAFSQ